MFAAIAFHILFYDVYFYHLHRIIHIPHLFLLIHKKHHSVDNDHLTFHDAGIAHWSEQLLENVGVFLPVLVYPWNKETPWILWCSFTFIYLRHLVEHEPQLSAWFGEHHILHHKHPRYNYGAFWIDWLYGTHYK
jgi:sterol desaturase/sphingolipid hydroxylase (fatty acid hydroxylase superfamily)